MPSITILLYPEKLWLSILSVSTSWGWRPHPRSLLSSEYITILIFSPQQRNMIRFFFIKKKKVLLNPIYSSIYCPHLFFFHNCTFKVPFSSFLYLTINLLTTVYRLVHYNCPHIIQSFSHMISLHYLSPSFSKLSFCFQDTIHSFPTLFVVSLSHLPSWMPLPFAQTLNTRIWVPQVSVYKPLLHSFSFPPSLPPSSLLSHLTSRELFPSPFLALTLGLFIISLVILCLWIFSNTNLKFLECSNCIFYLYFCP